jgi:hypothetical protein
MSEELVHITNTEQQVAQYTGPVDTGLDDIRVRPTNLILVQNTTRDQKGARPGQILDVLTGQAYDSVTVVPLRVIKNRVLFPPDADLDAEPLCRSSDGLVPSPFVKAPQATSCRTCPKAQWVGGQKPPCGEKLKLLVILKETGMPRYMQFGGKSISTCKEALEALKQDIKGKEYLSRGQTKLELFDYFFTVSGEKVTSRQGSYYVARFTDFGQVKNAGEFGRFYEEYAVRVKHDDDEQAVVAKDQAVDNKVADVIDAEVIEA